MIQAKPVTVPGSPHRGTTAPPPAGQLRPENPLPQPPQFGCLCSVHRRCHHPGICHLGLTPCPSRWPPARAPSSPHPAARSKLSGPPPLAFHWPCPVTRPPMVTSTSISSPTQATPCWPHIFERAVPLPTAGLWPMLYPLSGSTFRGLPQVTPIVPSHPTSGNPKPSTLL